MDKQIGGCNMKIGEFAKQFGVPKDTVRFYIKNNLLIPNDQGAQYEFTDREVQAMQTILKMKAPAFYPGRNRTNT